MWGESAIDRLYRDYIRKEVMGQKQYEIYKGTPYAFKTDSASVIIDNDKIYSGLTIRYNVYDDIMEIKKDDDYYGLPRESAISKFILGEHTFVCKSFNNKNGYFESLLKDPKCSLYLRYSMFLIEEQVERPYQEAVPAEFKMRTPQVFISLDNQVLVSLSSKKEFMELIPSNKEDITKFINKEKIKFNKPESIKQLVVYYNSL
jgi:hypothetical protein